MKWTKTESGIPSEIGIIGFLIFTAISAYAGYFLLAAFGVVGFLQFLTGRFNRKESSFFWFIGVGLVISMLLTYSQLRISLVPSLIAGQVILWVAAGIFVWRTERPARRVSEAMKALFTDWPARGNKTMNRSRMTTRYHA
ncbi:MAG: hypothetical protein JRM72_01395 [Nitrososphaerota archaeon]|nr:hypothetical protein [Nitrososphaerota archaeon]